MSRPPWVFAVALPVGEVLAPLYALRRATLVVVVLTILLLLGVVRMITAPVVNGIEACRALAEDISSGRLDRRLKVTSGDEVGQLAHSLNAMADQLDRNRRQVAAAEQKYRAIFENAVEGIFQTSVDGTVVAVNPALAALVGAESPDDLIGINVLSYYSDPALREIFLAQLRVHGAVHGFEGDIHRLDGTPRHVLLNARAEYNADGEIQTIRGFMEDVTERRAAEARAQNARETEDLLLRTELEMLRYQIDPHFLFNALTSLRELVLRDQQAGARMIESLAAFCRSGLLHRSDSVSTVGEEIAHAQSYLEVQAVRFGDRLRFRVDVEDAVREAPMPAFIVQPLAENGVKYGRKSGGNPLEVVLKAVADEPGCVLTVSNTGRWFAPEETQKSPGTQLGLDNVRKRLARCFGQRAQLSVLEADGWVTVSVSFPCDYARRSSGAAGDAAFR
jgi:PAS domain S-box-containing protein